MGELIRNLYQQWGVICIELFRSNTPKSLCCKEFSQLVPLSEELQRVIELIREKWPTTQILLRADSAYAREEIFKFCEEEERVDYAIAMVTNNQLKLRASDIIEKSKRDYEQRLEPVVELMETLFAKEEDLELVRKLVLDSTWYRSLCYQTEKSWSRQRRVVTKVSPGSEGLKIRHVVTSLPASKIPPSKLYTEKY